MTHADRIHDGDPTALDELDALHEAATPCDECPWQSTITLEASDTDEPLVPDEYWVWEVHAADEAILYGTETENPTADLALIVALRNAYPALAARVRALEAQLAAEQKGCEQALDDSLDWEGQAREQHARAERAEADADRLAAGLRHHKWDGDECDAYADEDAEALAAHAAAVAERDSQ